MAQNFTSVDTLGMFTVGNTYTFTYNDKVRIVHVERVLEGVANNGKAFIHCRVLFEDGIACDADTFKNFTIANIQGDAVQG